MDYMALLDDVIVNELKNLKDTKGETDEYKATVECVTKLMDRSIEIKKLTFDQTNKLSRQVIDDKAKAKQDEEDRYTLFLDRENTICLCSACHKDIHGRKKFQQPMFSQYVYDMKNYICQKYLAQGKIIRYTEDKNRRTPINKEKSKLF